MDMSSPHARQKWIGISANSMRRVVHPCLTWDIDSADDSLSGLGQEQENRWIKGRNCFGGREYLDVQERNGFANSLLELRSRWHES